MGRKKRKKTGRPFISKMLFLVLFLSLLYLYARYVEVDNIKVSEYIIKTSLIADSFDGFKIVQFSDLELGSTFNIENMESLVEMINHENADIVVFTGDLVSKYHDLTVSEQDELIKYFNQIESNLGLYAVRGDDDVNSIYKEVVNKTNFRDLTNNYELIYYKDMTPIIIYGLDSLLNGTQDLENTFSYPSIDDNEEFMAKYSILLVHEPDTYDKVKDYNLNLILSGHSHNSEVNIPYLKTLYKIKGATSYYDAYYKLDDTDLYISSGLGTSKYHVRINANPSISVYKLYKE